MTLFDAVDIERPCTPGDVESAEAAVGIRFPNSYRRFCLTYGAGLIGGLFEIAVPLPNPADPRGIVRRGAVLDARLRDNLEWAAGEGLEIGADLYENADLPLLRRARFFAQSYDGHELFWDVQGSAEEYPIHVSLRGELVLFGGATLDELIAGAQGPRVNTIFGIGFEPLPRSFVPFGRVAG